LTIQDTKEMTGDAFADLLSSYIEVLAIGLAASNPSVPPPVLVPALASAMGRVLSKFTVSPDLTLRLRLRKDASEAFGAAIKKHVPAIQHATTASIVAS
jgi:hypothetical protein